MKASELATIGNSLQTLGMNPDRKITLRELVKQLYPKIRTAREKKKWSWAAIAKQINTTIDGEQKISPSTLRAYMGQETQLRSKSKVTTLRAVEKDSNAKPITPDIVGEHEPDVAPKWTPPHHNQNAS